MFGNQTQRTFVNKLDFLTTPGFLDGPGAREKAGLTQEELARRLKTKKSAISRIENHAEDIRLSTLERTAEALGKRLQVDIV